MPTLLYIGELLIQLAFMAIIVMRSARNQAAAVAWIVVVLVFPAVLGAVIYLLVGEVRLGRWRVRRHDEIVARTKRVCREQWMDALYPELPPTYQPVATLAEAVGGTSPRGGNEVELFGDTDEVIERLIADIDAASKHCHLLFYIFMNDGTGRRVAEALQRAAARGVECRVLLDAVGSASLLASPIVDRMRDAGVRVVAALPANLLRAAFARLDLRNHRKLAVIDGEVGYTGSQNISDAAFAVKPRYAPWVDAMIRIRGPVVRDLQELFVEDWYLDSDEPLEHLLAIEPRSSEDGIPVQVMATGPGANNDALRQVLQAGIQLAREELLMTTPYFVPDAGTMDALCTAAARGVRTVLIVPRRNDSKLVSAASRSYYDQLLESGVEIYHYTKGLLHAKTITVDRDLALVSTANLDRRSFELNFEVSSIVYDSDFASQLRFLQVSYIDDSERVDPLVWRARAWHKELVQNASGMLSPLL